MTNLNDALVLVTGATGGFGRHMTEQFLAAGSRLILSDLDRDTLAAQAAEFAAGPGQIAACVAADLGSADGAAELFGEVQALGAVPDVLVNNAGIGVGGRFDHVPQERWEQVVEIDLVAPMRLCYHFLPRMLERGSGHIVNISSLAGWIGAPGIASYNAAKFGLRGFTEALAADYAELGLKFSAVYPFFSRTPILDSEQFGYTERRRVPDDMITDPADVVAAILKGIRANRLHIFPDRMARRIHYLKRYAPALLGRMLSRVGPA